MTKAWFLAVIVAGLVLSGPVFAHAKLQSTVPAADAQLKAAAQVRTPARTPAT